MEMIRKKAGVALIGSIRFIYKVLFIQRLLLKVFYRSHTLSSSIITDNGPSTDEKLHQRDSDGSTAAAQAQTQGAQRSKSA